MINKLPKILTCKQILVNFFIINDNKKKTLNDVNTLQNDSLFKFYTLHNSFL